jgi:hypothetical protein
MDKIISEISNKYYMGSKKPCEFSTNLIIKGAVWLANYTVNFLRFILEGKP